MTASGSLPPFAANVLNVRFGPIPDIDYKSIAALQLPESRPCGLVIRILKTLGALLCLEAKESHSIEVRLDL